MDDELSLHAKRMQELVAFTATSLETPYPSPFGGALYSASGELLAQAYDTVIKECDPTCHGEVNAIRLASKLHNTRWFAGSTLYSTCEPCAMCMAAAVWAGVDTLVFGAYTNEDATSFWPQEMSLRASDIAQSMVQRPQVKIFEGVERVACQKLFADYASALRRLDIRI